MTLEEAILELETMLAKYAFDVDEAQVIGVAIAALRPVSREKVEKVWRGEWNNINPVVLKPGVPWVCRCANVGVHRTTSIISVPTAEKQKRTGPWRW